jgi:hypothetical protein
MTAVTLALLLGTASPANMSLPKPFEGAPFVSQSWSCSPRKTCTRVETCAEAQWYLANCSWGYRLDGDSDGVPCETLCGNSH